MGRPQSLQRLALELRGSTAIYGLSQIRCHEGVGLNHAHISRMRDGSTRPLAPARERLSAISSERGEWGRGRGGVSHDGTSAAPAATPWPCRSPRRAAKLTSCRASPRVGCATQTAASSTAASNPNTTWPALAGPAKPFATSPNSTASGSPGSPSAPPPSISRPAKPGWAGLRASAPAASAWSSTTAASWSCPNGSVIPISPRACSACACAGSVRTGKPGGGIRCWSSRVSSRRRAPAARATGPAGSRPSA